MTTESDTCLLLGTLVQSLPDDGDGRPVLHVTERGALLLQGGRIAAAGEAAAVRAQAPEGTTIRDHGSRLIVPGFIDAHVHLPQTDIIGSHGEHLLAWLERYAYPGESAFASPAVAEETSRFFLDELLRNGTTTALVLGSLHPVSVETLFAQAHARGLRLIAGKLLMDRNCPQHLCDEADRTCGQTRELIRRWHGVGRLSYAITPRFAPTCSETQLAGIAELAAEYPDVYVHSHLAESLAELDWVRQLFPAHASYLDVYRDYGLLRKRALYAHCIYLEVHERQAMAQAGAAAVFCPTSNLFLGSGLFDHAASRRAGMRIGLGTDVGAGTSFSMLRTAAEAYKVSALLGQALSPAELLHLMTRGGAEALDLDDRIGSLAPGMEADCVVLDPEATPLSARRAARCESMEELLFATLILGDDRHVAAVYAGGRCQRERGEV